MNVSVGRVNGFQLFNTSAVFCARVNAHVTIRSYCTVQTASLLPSCKGYREGFLWKRGRDNGQYLSRRFILSEREGVLKYFNKHDVSLRPPRSSFHRLWVKHAHFSCSCLHFLQAREPKAMMKIGSLNATFQPSKIGTPHGLQITYLKDNSTRNIFVYHEEGKVKPVSAL